MKKILENGSIISANIKNEINKIERIQKNYDIVIEKHKNKQSLEVFYRFINENSLFYQLRYIANYINISKKTENKILLLADEVKYMRC